MLKPEIHLSIRSNNDKNMYTKYGIYQRKFSKVVLFFFNFEVILFQSWLSLLAPSWFLLEYHKNML